MEAYVKRVEEKEDETVRYIGFKIHGEYITEQARAALYERMHLQEAIDILKDALISDEISDEERLGIAMMILDGQADLVGVFPGDYHLEIHEENPNEEYRLARLSDDNYINRINELEKEVKSLNEKFAFCLEYASEYGFLRRLKSKYRAEYGERLCDIGEEEGSVGYGTALLEARLERMRQGEGDDDYGWLEPNGTFHAVPWGDHQEWASKKVMEMVEKGLIEADSCDIIDAGKTLCDRNWVLVHSPSQGIPFVTTLNVKGMTKAQKEFMYDYYIKRNQHEAANELYKED